MSRAAHQLFDEPRVFDDPIALAILGREAEQRIRAERERYRHGTAMYLRAFLVARSRIAEEALAAAVSCGVAQYVVLGAGLDTFAWRNPYSALRVFEVDHPATQGWKQRQLAGAGMSVPGSLTFVPVDFETQRLAARLRESGFRDDLPAFVSWLGVSMYLRRETVTDTLRYIASLSRGSGVVFDYAKSLASLSLARRLVVRAVMMRLAAIGEPWRTLFNSHELYALLRTLGYTRIEDIPPEAINARFFTQRSDMLRVGATGAVMLAFV